MQHTNMPDGMGAKWIRPLLCHLQRRHATGGLCLQADTKWRADPSVRYLLLGHEADRQSSMQHTSVHDVQLVDRRPRRVQLQWCCVRSRDVQRFYRCHSAGYLLPCGVEACNDHQLHCSLFVLYMANRSVVDVHE